MAHFEFILNLIWALLCLGAVLSHCLFQRRAAKVWRLRERFYSTICVFLATVSFFPAVSASDDRVLLRVLESQKSTGGGSSIANADNRQLAAQLQDVEHGKIAPLFRFFPPFHCLLVMELATRTSLRVFELETCSRAPPTEA